MIIAQQKKHENIIEYILYMMQIQDLIRACNFNINIIEEKLINNYQVSQNEKHKIKEWYSDLIISMQKEKLQEKGYLSNCKNIINDLDQLHKAIISEKQNIKYAEVYLWAKNNILAYKDKSKSNSENEVEICINALYGLLLLRLKNVEINPETKEAMQTISNLMGLLANHYHQNKN
jgi:hypothetical protein